MIIKRFTHFETRVLKRLQADTAGKRRKEAAHGKQSGISGLRAGTIGGNLRHRLQKDVRRISDLHQQQAGNHGLRQYADG